MQQRGRTSKSNQVGCYRDDPQGSQSCVQRELYIGGRQFRGCLRMGSNGSVLKTYYGNSICCFGKPHQARCCDVLVFVFGLIGNFINDNIVDQLGRKTNSCKRGPQFGGSKGNYLFGTDKKFILRLDGRDIVLFAAREELEEDDKGKEEEAVEFNDHDQDAKLC